MNFADMVVTNDDDIDCTLSDEQVADMFDTGHAYVNILFNSQTTPLAIVDVDASIADVFTSMDVYLHGTYSVHELFNIIRERAQTQLVLQYSD